MTTITAKKSGKPVVDGVLKVDQSRPTEARYRLQVDRQMKASFATFEEADEAGKSRRRTLLSRCRSTMLNSTKQRLWGRHRSRP
jgi:hypothetical protein